MAVREAARWITSPPVTGEVAETRPLTARNYTMLWAALCASLLAFVPGAYLVPALRLRDAILVAILASFAGAAVLGAVAATAARRRQNTVGLLSSTLGVPARSGGAKRSTCVPRNPRPARASTAAPPRSRTPSSATSKRHNSAPKTRGEIRKQPS